MTYLKKDYYYCANQYLSLIYDFLINNKVFRTCKKYKFYKSYKSFKLRFKNMQLELLNQNKQVPSKYVPSCVLKLFKKITKYALGKDNFKKENKYYINTTKLNYAISCLETLNKLEKAILKDYKKMGEFITNKSINSFILRQRKDNNLNNVSKNGEVYKAKIFYLCSTHLNCSSKHFNYQGKLYVDKSWKRQVAKNEIKSIIKRYIKLNNIQTIQKVIKKPIKLATDINCNHYFKALTLEEVFSNSVNKLLLDNNMVHDFSKKNKIENDKNNNLKENNLSKDNIIYSVLNQYRKQLKIDLNIIKRQKNNDKLKEKIKSEKELIEKWEKILYNKNT